MCPNGQGIWGMQKSGLSSSSAPVARGDPSQSIPLPASQVGSRMGWAEMRAESIMRWQHGFNTSRIHSQTSSTAKLGVLLCSPSPWHSAAPQPCIQRPRVRPNSLWPQSKRPLWPQHMNPNGSV